MQNSTNSHRIGVDLGGTKIECVILDQDGKAIFRKRRPTQADQGYDRILENIVAAVEEARAAIPANADASIGLGIPGMLDIRNNLVQNANTTVLIGKPLGRDLQNVLQQQVIIENDANCFTLAECNAGAARNHDFVFGVIMGTGCGGGICIDGRVRRGPHGIAGEWGHASIDPNGATCYSGIVGCIESKISGSGVQAAHRSRTGQTLTMAEIVAGYRKGDAICTETMQQFFRDFGRALAVIVNSMDPDAIVLGGGLSNIEELYTEGWEALRSFAFHDDLQTPLLKNELGDSAGVFGAAWIGGHYGHPQNSIY